MLVRLKVGLVVGCAVWLAGCAALRDNQDAKVREDEVATAWWIDKEFRPTQTMSQGLPVARFDSDWVRAQVLDDEYIEKQIDEDEYQAVINSQLKFDLRHSIDDDPAKEHFIVGVYEAKSGDKGRFLAVLDGGTVAKVFQYPGLAGYSALILMDGDMYWYKCMECDDFDKVSWSGTDYYLE